ncbi:MAG TPA: FkbM family methyltransferase [Kiritimatiellia bacterium]|nr:FkbM family methyltransferase [Kiritimatiellia bacterium]
MVNSIRHNIAQRVFNRLLSAQYHTPSDKLKSKIWHSLRRGIVRFGDPLVKYNLGLFTIYIPLSHNLPIDLKNFPEYNGDLVKLAALIRAKYQDLHIIDIGANVGDTAAMIRSSIDSPILCIEGDGRYYNILTKNINSMPNVESVQCYIDARSASIQIAKSFGRGTGYLDRSETSKSENVDTYTLPDILRQFARFSNAKLLKIDTDGFDGNIIRGASDWIKHAHPIIFFEYAANLMAQNGDDGLSLFNFLAELGYTCATIHRDMGGIINAVEPLTAEQLKDIDREIRKGWLHAYVDITAFHSEDRDVFQSFSKR